MTYDYTCTNCKASYEEQQSIKDNSLIKCKFCYKDTLVRVIGSCGFVLQGRGWPSKAMKRSG